MANITITQDKISSLIDVDGKQLVFHYDLDPACTDRSGDIVRIIDAKGLLKSAGIDQMFATNKNYLTLDLSVDTIDVDGETSFADAGELFDAVRDVLFLK